MVSFRRNGVAVGVVVMGARNWTRGTRNELGLAREIIRERMVCVSEELLLRQLKGDLFDFVKYVLVTYCVEQLRLKNEPTVPVVGSPTLTPSGRIETTASPVSPLMTLQKPAVPHNPAPERS